MSERIRKIFETKGKKLITFTTGGDPDLNTSFEILETIINNGIDTVSYTHLTLPTKRIV